MRAFLHLVLACVLGIGVPSAAAQPIACEPCVRGDALIEKFSLQAVRPLAAELAALPLAEPLTEEQYAHVVELRQRTPSLVRVGAVDDSDLALVASALCLAASGDCVTSTTHALQCLADRCAVALPMPDPRTADVATVVPACTRYYSKRRSPPLGLGFEWGNGVQRSQHPTDGRAWSLGIESRLRLNRQFGVIARIDRSAGRDEQTDADGNGTDDVATGTLTRVSALAGPSFLFNYSRYEGQPRFLRVDLLGGYLATRSHPDESGPAAGADFTLQLAIVTAGVRVVQGFGDATDATMLIGHLGIIIGAAPEPRVGPDCEADHGSRSSRLALGFDMSFGGYGFPKQLGALIPGIGIEALWNLTKHVDLATRADLLVFPGDERDSVIHSAALAGLRVDHGSRGRSTIGFFSTVMLGYTHGAGFTPTTSGTGPVTDVSVGWGGQDRDGAAYLRLHGRFGISPDNVDYRAVFLSAGFELRFDGTYWRRHP